MHGKSLMFPGTASPVVKSVLCAAVLRSRGIYSGGHLVDKSLFCAAVLRSHGIYSGGHLVDKSLLCAAALGSQGIYSGMHLHLAVKDEAANVWLAV